jgi:hypothetical protein
MSESATTRATATYCIGDPMRIKYVTLTSVAALLVAATPAAGQVFCTPTDETSSSDNDLAACLAATTTPFGALPTNLPANWISGAPAGIGFSVLFGNMDEEGDFGRRNIGVGVEIPAGRASIGFTGGLVDFTCDVPGTDINCKSAIMLGGRFATPLITGAVGTGAAASSIIVGLNGSVGFSNGDVLTGTDFFGDPFEISGRAFSVGLGLPVGLVAKSGTVSITPFLEPAFFWGQTRAEGTEAGTTSSQTESGTGFSLGGGLMIGFANGVGLQVGFKKVMIDEANAMIGVGVSFQR